MAVQFATAVYGSAIGIEKFSVLTLLVVVGL
jgi:hypothetical protein